MKDVISYRMLFKGEDLVGWQRRCGHDGDPFFLTTRGKHWNETPIDSDDYEEVSCEDVPMTVRTTTNHYTHQQEKQYAQRKGTG